MSLIWILIVAVLGVVAFCGRDMLVLGRRFAQSLVECFVWLKTIDDFFWKP